MLVTAIEVQGFRDLPSFSASDLGRVVDVRGPTPATTALGDALELAFAAFHADTLRALLARWGLLGPGENPEILGTPLPEQATWQDRQAAGGLIADPHTRTLSVTVELALDPLQFGQLREVVAREPRLVAALSAGSRMKVTVSGLFAASLDALALGLSQITIGGEGFPSAPGQRPPWLSALLGGLGSRFVRHDPLTTDLAARALQAATGRHSYAGYQRWQAALRPTLGEVRAARGPGDRPILLAGDRPLRAYGAEAHSRAALAADIYLSGADLLLAETTDPWLDEAVDGEGSPLEQVWRVGPEGALGVPDPEVRAPSAPLPLRAARA